MIALARVRRPSWPIPTVPGLRNLSSWRQHPVGDVVAGVAVAAYLVPQCLAYARLAGVEPVSGLWTALPALVIYAFLGTSTLLSVGPESASALLVGSSVATLSASSNVDPAAIAGALALAVAAVSFVAWIARLGFLADLLSRPVLVGYLAGVAVTMTVSQLPNLTGVQSTHRETIDRAVDVISGIDDVHPAPLVLGLSVIAVLVALQRVRRLPGALVVVLAATVITSVFDLDEHHVTTLGHVPSGLPSIVFPSIPAHLWPGVFGAAAGIAIVAFSGNMLTARAFARDSTEQIDADQELVALAGANAVTGLLHGFPVSSSDSRTALAVASGGSSQLTSIVAAGCLALVLLVAAPVLEAFPLAGLAGLVVYAASRLIDIAEIRRIFAFRLSEAMIMIAAFIGVVAFDLLVGIGVAVALSVGDLLRRIARAHDAVQGIVPNLAGLHDIEDYPDATTIPGLVVYRYDAPLCFANIEDFRRRVLKAIDDEATPVEWVVLNMEANVEIDLSATDMLEELRSHLESRGIVMALARVKQDLALYLRRSGLDGRIGADHIFPTLPTALEGFRERSRSE